MRGCSWQQGKHLNVKWYFYSTYTILGKWAQNEQTSVIVWLSDYLPDYMTLDSVPLYGILSKYLLL